MTDRRRNLFIILLVLGLLAASVVAIVTKPTRLGLDLKGGVELVYEAQPTPKVPEITPQAVDDAITTIRKRTDALGVAEPEIQRSGANQISVALPAVKNAERAIKQVGTTAQLQFYAWEENVRQAGGNPDRPAATLYEAVRIAARARPKAEPTDVPPGGPDPAVARRLGGDRQQIQQFYDRRNDTAGVKLYLFGPGKGPDRRLLEGPAPSCAELLATFEDRLRGGPGPPPRPTAVTDNRDCRADLARLAKVEGGPPPGSQVIAVPRGIAVLQAERPAEAPPDFEVQRHYPIEDDSELSGAELKNPEQATDPQTNEPIVTFNFTDSGRRAFAAVTKRLAERGAATILPPGQPPSAAFQRFAISLDNQVVSLATIDFRENPEGIDGRTGAQINGIGSIQETRDLAESLRIGALPIDLKLISNTQVSATLGKQALNQGLVAAGAGLLLTLLFLVGFYRALGVVAGVALLTYAVLLYAVVKLIPITLTLPGIAGLILTLGVAADANIVIFERIKEEARLGASIPRAIASGYAKALRTIVDANVVTIGVAFILFMLATAGVKGFAFTLGIGTIVSLFTAVLATSAILGSLARTRVMRSPLAVGAGPERVRWRFDFTGLSKWFFSMSGLILLAGALAIAGLGIKFGIDFESGTRIVTPIERPASVAQVRDALPPDLRDAKIQQVNDPELGRNVYQLSVPQLPPPEVERVREQLDERFGVRRADFTATSIGPTFGAQIARTAVIAIIASLFLISLYIGLRFQFKFAVPVLIALAHDLLITAGVYALAEREVTTSTVAALLTILGYSLYDTIIVFDRIRENVPRMPRATFSQIVNRSMSEVLTRSLATSFSTLLPITALMLFGGETLRDFGFALLVGVASGTYSSVFIASPVLTLWKEREPAYRRRRELAMEEHGGVVPAFATAAAGDRPADGEARPARPARRRERTRRRAPARAGPAHDPGARAGAGEEGTAGDGAGRAPAGPVAGRPAAGSPQGGDGAPADAVPGEAAERAGARSTAEAAGEATEVPRAGRAAPAATAPPADRGAAGGDGVPREDGGEPAGEMPEPPAETPEPSGSAAGEPGPARERQRQNRRRKKKHGRR